jgi:hypothetical protein
MATDPKQVLAILEGVFAGANQLLAAGGAQELGLFTPQEGYGIFEAASADAVLGMVNPFFPLYSQEIRAIVPWDAGSKAILASARQAAM